MLMRSLILMAGLLSASIALGADTAAPKWEAGKSYVLINPSQPTSTGNKIEVLEVFSYACSHCAHFQPYAEKLKASLPANAEFLLLPADFQPRWVLFARGFYVAKGLGLIDKTHQAMFDAIYRDNQPMNTLDQIADFYAGHGADKATFLSTAESFVVEGGLAHAHQMEVHYGIDSTPTLIVNGKYRVVANAGENIGFDEMVEIVQYLVATEVAQNKH